MSSQGSLTNYTFIKTIGEGTFGKVKLALHNLTQEKVAIKILEKNKIRDKKDLERIEKEIKYMKMLNHPNIVKIYEIIEDENNFYISMEYVPGGELFNYIVKNKRLNDSESSFFYSQIIHIIQEIHKHKICHRDLKPENLLLSQNKTIKLIDFGLSNEYQDFLMTPCGSPCYASPEVIRGNKYSGLGIDLWASGIILFSMLCGYLPFDDKNNDDLFKKILKCNVVFPQKKNVIISEEAKDLIRKILQPEPSKRITLEEILKHPFLTFGNKKYKEKIRMDINKQDKLIIDYMTNIMGISNKNDIIRENINNNRHNHLTTIFYLLKKKYNEGRFDYNKLNKIINIEVENNNKILMNNFNSENIIDNIIKKKVMKNNNIIIINNNNILNQQRKINYLFDPLINDKNNIKQNYEKIVKKIDTSISIEKPRRNNKSPEIIKINDNSENNFGKIREKKIFHKKYLNSSTFRDDFFNQKNNEDKNIQNRKIYNLKKKIDISLHLKANTNFQNFNLHKIQNTTHYDDFREKNNSLISSFINTENNNKRTNIYHRIRLNTGLNNSIIHNGSPDDKISSRYTNYCKNIDRTLKYEKLNTIGNHKKNFRKSVNVRNDKNYIVDLINSYDSTNSINNNKDISKENFYKKINLNKLKEANKNIKVNKLALNDSSIGNNLNNNISGYKDDFRKKHIYMIKDKMNKTINTENENKIETKRLKLKLKGIMNKSTLNDSITYSKKICAKNKTYIKSNNYLMLSTNLNLYQITKRLSKFCNQNNLLLEQNGEKYIIILDKENEFMLDIKNNEGSYIIKFTHEKGEESKTKVFMNNLFSEIAK